MQTPEQFVSQAYLANLAETYIEKVEFDKKYEPLIHAFHSFPALKNHFENLLKEVFHPYRNTQLVLEELRLFLLNNVGYIYKNEFFDQFLQLLFDLLFGFYGEEKDVNTKVSEIILSLLKKTIENGRDITKLKFLFNNLIERFLGLNEDQFKSFFEIAISLKKILWLINEKIVDEDLEFLSRQLLIRYFSNVYSLYRQIKDRLPSNQEIIENFNLIEQTDLTVLTLKELLSLPDHLELLRILKEVIFKIISYKETSLGEEERVSVLLSLLQISDLGLLHEELLRDVNKILVSMIEAKPHEHIEEFIVKFFVFLKQKSNLYPWTVFECIKSIGTAILRKRAVYLTEVFIQEVLKYGFTPPAITGIDLNWRVKRNPYHVQNIKVWLEIYRQNPEWCSSLLIGLIIYIKLYGVSINDTDLFQREISNLLNSDIKHTYNQVKQFCRNIPVFFHEIGAEGLIRDLSTHLDEIYGRKNTLFHFLRKFIHVESSSLVVNLMEDIMRFWFTLNPSHIAKYLPDVLLNKIISEEFKYHLEMQNILFSIFKLMGIYEIEKLFELNVDQLERYISSINADNHLKTVIINFLKLYNLIRQKYYFSLSDLEELVREFSGLGFNFVEELPTVLKEKKLYEQIEILLTWLLHLKEDYILSSEKFQKKEEIIKKRHIAADIPSIFGRYSEPKFDALGLSFRLEWILNTLFAKLTEEFRFQIFSESTMKKILNIMKLFKTALEVDGISSQRFNRYLHILENSLLSYPLTFNQYVDIFKGLLEGVQHIIKSYYINPYFNNFVLIYEVLDKKNLLDKYRKVLTGKKTEEAFHSLLEILLRDIISESFVIKHLDNFLKKVYNSLIQLKNMYTKDELNMLLTYDYDKSISYLHKPDNEATDTIYLGNKAYNLLLLSTEENVKVKIPYGFVLTTELFRIYPLLKKYKQIWALYEDLIKAGVQYIESSTGKQFNSLDNPLLLSVRSGAVISMPGMMSSILNVGINPTIVESLAKISGNEWFVWDTYRRFLQSWAMANGIPRDVFNALMRDHKRRYNVKKKREFSGEQMKELAFLYRKKIEEYGVPVIDDPWEQLFKCIELIFNSWYFQKATFYREIMGIAEEWGTAILVQEMIFGNLKPDSGTGVVFTTSPYGKFPRVALWGDYTPYNQGEDIVSGLVNAYPISIEQKKIEGREGEALEEAFPEIYNALLELAYYLVYEKGWDHQEIEFTFEGPKREGLYILQVRDIHLREEKYIPYFKISFLKNLPLIGKGIGVSGTILSGRVVFSLEDIENLKPTQDPLILLRYDTVPDNIREISLVDGLLTARGGQTSHAAIVANRLGKVCVVGCEELRIDDEKKLAKIKDFEIKLYDWITLNAMTGDVYYGKIVSKVV